MGLFDQFPYTNFHELNLDWILQALKELEHTIEQFVSINALKYADPIQWNITKQYEKNTIVIDPLTGTAYISVQPVPNGVALTNEDYWTVVFDLGSFVTRAAQNFTLNWETQWTQTATFPSTVGSWLVWNDTLYKVISNIITGDQYVIDSNIKRFTMEEYLGHIEDLDVDGAVNIINAINIVYQSLLANEGDLEDLITEDKSNLVAALNEIATQVLGKIGNLEDLDTTDKSNLVAAINEVFNLITSKYKIYNVLNYGASSSLADNSTAFNNAINAAYAGGGIVYIPNGVYTFTNSIVLKDRVSLIGESMRNTILQTSDAITLIDIVNVNLQGIILSDFTLWQNNANRTGIGIAGGSNLTNYNSAIGTFKNILIHGFYDGINGKQVPDGVGIFDCIFINLHIDMCGNGINVSGSGNVYLHLRMTNNVNGFYFTHMNGHSYDGGTVIGGVFILNDYDISITGINRPISFLGTWFEQCKYGIINCPSPTAGYGFVFRSCMLNTNSNTWDLVNLVNYSGLSSVDDCTIIQTVDGGMTNVLGVDTYRYVVEYKDGTSRKFSSIPTQSQVNDIAAAVDDINNDIDAIESTIALLPIYRVIDCAFNNTDVVTITHNLGRVPINVQLTPATNLQGHSIWVGNYTSTTFDVHIDEVITLSAFFYAQIR